jgi:nitroreductase
VTPAEDRIMTEAYDPKVTPWQIREEDFPAEGTLGERLTFLLRYAILAPSTHNTQPWKFRIKDAEIEIHVDRSRWLRVADADQRELHISIGCALENLLIAAEHFGMGHHVIYFPETGKDDHVATVRFVPDGEPTQFRRPELFDAIVERATNHHTFEARAVPDSERRWLADCCAEEGIALWMTDDAEIKRKVDGLTERADAEQFADPAWRQELGRWLGQGVFGNSWMVSKLGQLAVTYLNLSKGIAKKDSDLLQSAPLLAVLTSKQNHPDVQTQIGQAFQRIALTATVLGLRVHPMSQILEFPELKQELMMLLPKQDLIPQHTFRLGYAIGEVEHTPRRPLSEVLL